MQSLDTTVEDCKNSQRRFILIFYGVVYSMLMILRRQLLLFIIFIEHITESDIKRVATKLFSSKLSMAALGTLDRLPDVELVRDMVKLEKPMFGGILRSSL